MNLCYNTVNKWFSFSGLSGYSAIKALPLTPFGKGFNMP